MTSYRAKVLIAFGAIICFASTAQSAPISKLVQQACKVDYRKYCGEYGLETAALRLCMDRAGHGLSQGCVEALIQAGEVSRAEVDRRKKSSR